MLKKGSVVIGFIPFVLLAGCNIGGEADRKTVPMEKVEVSRYADMVSEGEYQGVLNEKFIDVVVDGELEMYAVTEEVGKQLKQLEEEGRLKLGTKMIFTHSLNNKTFDQEMHLISEFGGKVIALKEEKPVNEVEKEKVEKIKMEIDYKTGTKIVEATEEDFLYGKFKVIDTFEWDGEQLENDDTTITFTEVVDTVENDVQKERWRAASILEEYGEFKEEKVDSKGEVKFVFYVEDEENYKEISVIKNKYGYFRIEVETKIDNKDNAKAEMNGMVESLN